MPVDQPSPQGASPKSTDLEDTLRLRIEEEIQSRLNKWWKIISGFIVVIVSVVAVLTAVITFAFTSYVEDMANKRLQKELAVLEKFHENAATLLREGDRIVGNATAKKDELARALGSATTEVSRATTKAQGLQQIITQLEKGLPPNLAQAVSSAAEQWGSEVRTKKLTILDERGDVRATLSASPDGGLAVMGSAPENEGRIVVSGGGNASLVLVANGNGGRLSASDNEGRERVFIRGQSDRGVIALRGRNPNDNDDGKIEWIDPGRWDVAPGMPR